VRQPRRGIDAHASEAVLARISPEELEHLFRGYGYTPYFVEGHEPDKMHELMAGTLDTILAEIWRIKAEARRSGFAGRPRWGVVMLLDQWMCSIAA
jgi:xylulose-5-phosphate/fructose-6-phosphate phosphoketolase